RLIAHDRARRAMGKAIAEHEQGKTPSKADDPALADLVRLCHSSLRLGSHPWTDKYGARFFAALRMTRESWWVEPRSGTPDDRVVARVADGIIEFMDGLRSGDIKGAGEALAALIGLGVG